MKVIPVCCLDDNYSYLIIDEKSKEAAAVDPAEPEKIIEVARKNGVRLKLVLTTHHHWDHAGGNKRMSELIPGIRICGGEFDPVPACTDAVHHNEEILLGENVTVLCLHTPCHTKGHISYYVSSKDEDAPSVFTGDTLFIAGCGKFFEGTADQMYGSLHILSSLPKSTRVYCGHEYTVKNLKFAETVEPNNIEIKERLLLALNQRAAGMPTVPSTVGEEVNTNPFMMVDLPRLQETLGSRTPIGALAELRARKDAWRG